MTAKKQDLDIESLTPFFTPQSIAVIGSSSNEQSAGYGVLKSLARGGVYLGDNCKEFSGKLYAVNPDAEFVLGYKCYKRITDLPDPVDLAIICVSAKNTVSVMKDCVKQKIHAAVIISSGFAETGVAGGKVQAQLLAVAETGKIRVLGPNSMGVLRPLSSLNASFAATMPPSGDVGFISQSGSLANTVLDGAITKKYGFSAIASYGNAADVDESDLLTWLGNDDATHSIAVYLEGVHDGRKFIDVAKEVSQKKPIVVLKGGKLDADFGSSHTGVSTGSYTLYQAAFKQAGVIEAESVDELFNFAKTLAHQPACAKNRVAVVTNSGGCCVLAADYCEALNVSLTELKPVVVKKLSSFEGDQSNPLDLGDAATPEHYRTAISALLDTDTVEGVIVVQTLQSMSSAEATAKVLVELQEAHPQKAFVSAHIGGRFSKEAWKLLEANGIPDFTDLRKAVRAMSVLVKRGEMVK
jgi:acyl-CoA synthetase (NDP forming)